MGLDHLLWRWTRPHHFLLSPVTGKSLRAGLSNFVPARVDTLVDKSMEVAV